MRGVCYLVCKYNHVHGIVDMQATFRDGIEFAIYIRGIREGRHGFHVHRSGNAPPMLRSGASFVERSIDEIKHAPCSLCDHYNPHNKTHGDRNDPNAHAGDLGNVTSLIYPGRNVPEVIDTFVVNTLTLNEIVGRSLIVHASADDLGKGGDEESLKTGNSGGRVLWGIIAINEVC